MGCKLRRVMGDDRSEDMFPMFPMLPTPRTVMACWIIWRIFSISGINRMVKIDGEGEAEETRMLEDEEEVENGWEIPRIDSVGG